MQTNLMIIPLSAVRDAYAQHEVLDGGEMLDEAEDYFDQSVNNSQFSYGAADITLVTVKRFADELPEFEAAVFNVLSSEPDYVRGMDETIYVDLEA